MTHKRLWLLPEQSTQLNRKKRDWYPFRICPQVFISKNSGLSNILTYFAHIPHKSTTCIYGWQKPLRWNFWGYCLWGTDGLLWDAGKSFSKYWAGSLGGLQKARKYSPRTAAQHSVMPLKIPRLAGSTRQQAVPAQGLQRQDVNPHEDGHHFVSCLCTLFSWVSNFPKNNQPKHSTCTHSAPIIFS